MFSGSDRGTVTVELAIGIPIVLGVVGLGLGALKWGMDAVAAVSMATESALDVSRGAEATEIIARLTEESINGNWSIGESAAGVCVTGTINSPLPLLQPIEIERCSSH